MAASYGERTCPTCGTRFIAHRVNQRYCNPAHRPTGGTPSNTSARGYGTDHQALRRKWQRRFDDGEHIECHALICLMTTRLIDPAEPWDLGHTRDRQGWTGPEHRRCNRTEPQFRASRIPTAGAPEHWEL